MSTTTCHSMKIDLSTFSATSIVSGARILPASKQGRWTLQVISVTGVIKWMKTTRDGALICSVVLKAKETGN